MKYLGSILFGLIAISGAWAEQAAPAKTAATDITKWDLTVKDPNDPNDLMRTKWDSVAKVLQNKKLDEKAKADIVDHIISPVFDFELMGKLALGKTHWSKLNAEEQKTFTALFVQRLKVSYRDKIMLYKDEQVQFQPAVQKKLMIQIPMTLISNSKKTAILYKLHKLDKTWKVYDVEIEGVSILLTYRSQFDDILARGTVKDLLSQLEKTSDS
ncbi:MAG: ABC transporter substrate-binding protein [Sedimentisphaerales bacterium]|nr:ABC transporter substrate-binding protein [Sedimentisphaerales bacterium]